MTHHRNGLKAAALLLFLALVFSFGARGVFAAGDQPPGPDRFVVVTQNYTSYEWWLTGWQDNQVACSVTIDHDGMPDGGEIYAACGEFTYDEWAATEPCSQTDVPGACSGYYLQFVKSGPAQRKVGVLLPPPVVWVTLDGCVPYNSTFRCNVLPTLVLTGEEPLEGEHITGLVGKVNDEDFACDPICQVDLAPTGQDGIDLEFWAYSSYGDSSELFTARVRVAASDDSANHGWYVDVLSTQWRGAPLAGCSQVWEAFPPVGGPPEWLSTPLRPEELSTDILYTYLAANLIKQGVADASSCDDGGLLDNGLASQCGVESARGAVRDWQNRFDSLIFSAAQETSIPAQLLKNIFSRESQFWPGVIIGHPEAGLGQMTENGADTTLLWNRPFFEQFCPTILNETVCRKGYPHLQPEQQTMLQGALVRSIDAFCPDCALGIDLSRAENSVAVFVEAMLANCEQAGMIVYNTYEDTPGGAAAYEDLWRFTLVNYNAGPGCLTLAIRENRRLNEPLDWEHLSSHLTPACMGALDYVADVSQASP